MIRPRSLHAGELRVASAPGRLVIHGLGSCVAVFVYDPDARVGGLAHILLPAPPRSGPQAPPEKAGRYATTAVASMVEASIRLGARRQALLAKITGGSRMFAFDAGSPRETVGDKNVEAALRVLQDLRVKVVGRDVGGIRGRTVVADLSDGSLVIRTARGEERRV
ncbi:MAG: chemotaxis protein CheD [Candidatus Polarisedimenticolia bacterium]